MKVLRSRLSAVGLKRTFLNKVVLPSWWDDSLAESTGGFREGASHVAARLGFPLADLLNHEKPLVMRNPGGVKYKKARGVSEGDVCLMTNYAIGVARAAASAYLEEPPAASVPAAGEWRSALQALSDRPWVCLRHMLEATWRMGIPVLHVRNLPAGARKPDALTTMVGDRPVIVILSGRKSPSWVAFTVAHELGHLHHGHLQAGQTLVDEKIETRDGGPEETEANEYASRLLTGQSDFGLHSSRSLGPAQLATQAKVFGEKYRVAPGVAALNYGFTTGSWGTANGAVTLLEKNDDAAVYLQTAQEAHLDRAALSEDSWEWIARATAANE